MGALLGKVVAFAWPSADDFPLGQIIGSVGGGDATGLGPSREPGNAVFSRGLAATKSATGIPKASLVGQIPLSEFGRLLAAFVDGLSKSLVLIFRSAERLDVLVKKLKTTSATTGTSFGAATQAPTAKQQGEQDGDWRRFLFRSTQNNLFSIYEKGLTDGYLIFTAGHRVSMVLDLVRLEVIEDRFLTWNLLSQDMAKVRRAVPDRDLAGVGFADLLNRQRFNVPQTPSGPGARQGASPPNPLLQYAVADSTAPFFTQFPTAAARRGLQRAEGAGLWALVETAEWVDHAAPAPPSAIRAKLHGRRPSDSKPLRDTRPFVLPGVPENSHREVIVASSTYGGQLISTVGREYTEMLARVKSRRARASPRTTKYPPTAKTLAANGMIAMGGLDQEGSNNMHRKLRTQLKNMNCILYVGASMKDGFYAGGRDWAVVTAA
eukprot:g13027.t1